MSVRKKADAKRKFSRRDFLVTGSTAVAVDALIATTASQALASQALASPAPTAKGDPIPESKGYLVYDSKKCAGCTTCMLSCSLTHYGIQNLSLARIQIIQDSFGKFPDDIKMAPCRQCVTPPCVINCPVGAAFIDKEHGNVRRIDQNKCIGCHTCIKMCPQQPHRTVWVTESLTASGKAIKSKSSKCDLCIDTPYWNEEGGPGGRQACVETCPMKAIKFVSEAPNQEETDGYDVKLRNEHWFRLGYVDEDKPRDVAPASMNLGAGAPKSNASTAKPKD